MSVGLLAGKRGLIMGVANDRSIAWGIAKQCAAQGAELAFTYQGDALGKRVKPLAESLGDPVVMDCDVTTPCLRIWKRLGASWTFWSMPLDFLTKMSCAGAMLIPRLRISR